MKFPAYGFHVAGSTFHRQWHRLKPRSVVRIHIQIRERIVHFDRGRFGRFGSGDIFLWINYSRTRRKKWSPRQCECMGTKYSFITVLFYWPSLFLFPSLCAFSLLVFLSLSFLPSLSSYFPSLCSLSFSPLYIPILLALSLLTIVLSLPLSHFLISFFSFLRLSRSLQTTFLSLLHSLSLPSLCPSFSPSPLCAVVLMV